MCLCVVRRGNGEDLNPLGVPDRSRWSSSELNRPGYRFFFAVGPW